MTIPWPYPGMIGMMTNWEQCVWTENWSKQLLCRRTSCQKLPKFLPSDKKDSPMWEEKFQPPIYRKDLWQTAIRTLNFEVETWNKSWNCDVEVNCRTCLIWWLKVKIVNGIGNPGALALNFQLINFYAKSGTPKRHGTMFTPNLRTLLATRTTTPISIFP